MKTEQTMGQVAETIDIRGKSGYVKGEQAECS